MRTDMPTDEEIAKVRLPPDLEEAIDNVKAQHHVLTEKALGRIDKFYTRVLKSLILRMNEQDKEIAELKKKKAEPPAKPKTKK